jgi:hypothetical protein
MAYYLDLFTPETWEGFQKHGGVISGFRERQQAAAQRIKPGDIFLCYLVHLSRWCGALEVMSASFQASEPIFTDPDPFTIRFHVKPIVTLSPEVSVPVFDDKVWGYLEETKDIKKGSRGWGMIYRSSLRLILNDDGDFLLSLLQKQVKEKIPYELTDRDKRNLARKGKVQTLTGLVEVEVPGADEETDEPPGISIRATPEASDSSATETRQSIQVQAQIAEIGAKMGFRIWIPSSDRVRVVELVEPTQKASFIEALPLNYDENTLDTIRQIDVLWLKGRSMARAFEVEHTTAIYSGILRMADLLALQPNMQIRLHIVAPVERREKVLREIKRPVFSLLDHGPLYEKCTFLSYDSIHSLAQQKFLTHMSDTILDEYEEHADDG